MAELQIRLIEALGKHKLATAQAELIEATAAQAWAVGNIKQQVAHQLHEALQRLATVQHQTASRIQRIHDAAQRALLIRLGESLDPDNGAHVWNGFSFFS